MFKFVLAAALSVLLVADPATAATKSKGKVRHKITLVRHVKAKPLKAIVKDNREGMVRRVAMVRGKRRVIWQHARTAAPAIALLTAGDMAGLNRTRDPLDLRSSVAFVQDQNSAEVLFEKNSTVALPIASITKLMKG